MLKSLQNLQSSNSLKSSSEIRGTLLFNIHLILEKQSNGGETPCLIIRLLATDKDFGKGTARNDATERQGTQELRWNLVWGDVLADCP